MVARALFSFQVNSMVYPRQISGYHIKLFQAQNNRELSFKKGDIIYIKKQVDSNWYEGERNAMLGIFPTTYVEIVPTDAVVCRSYISICRFLHVLGNYSYKEREKLRWRSKSKIQFYSTNTHGTLTHKRLQS